MNRLAKWLLVVGISGLVPWLVAGCAEEGQQQPGNARIESDNRTEPASTGTEKFSQVEKVTAELVSTKTGEPKGQVTFTPNSSDSTVLVRVDLSGLKPGKHGFHIHAHPSCDDEGSDAGGHFNPQGTKHGGPDSATHHAGDMGNITADSNGNVQTTLQLDKLAFSGPNNILNKTVIVHANRDDLTSQPAGDSGERVACGMIRPQKRVTTSP